MFPWAVKRVFKFLLKKQLGQFILGDIDVEQLDVQFRAGTIRLSDLAINVDFINQKIGGASPMTIKEGSIGSLLVQMPWIGKGCQIELDELEIVVVPRVKDTSFARGESFAFSEDDKYRTKSGLGNVGVDTVEFAAASSSLDVHEGVKTIAKMIKCLLTSFQINVNKMIIVFDPCLENDVKEVGRHTIVVLRVSEIECGTCVSEEIHPNGDATIDSLLGVSRLKNYVKFKGALLELLQIENGDKSDKSFSLSATETALGEVVSGSCLLNARTSIMTGENGGVSGNVTLSIPWKNGSLDMSKVDTEVSVDPMKFNFQPSTVKWFLLLWGSLKNLDNDVRVHVDHNAENSVYFNSESHFQSFILGSDAIFAEKFTPGATNINTVFPSATGKDLITEGLLPGSRIISDWVPSSINKGDGRDEIDFGASMDQFFECFDELRTSQSALASSGLLNWTSSVFSAITAASNLASGSLEVLPEQQHIETNLNASIAAIYISFSLNDEDQKELQDRRGVQADARSGSHCLVTEFRGIILALQVRAQDTKFELKAESIVLDDYSNNENGDRHCRFCSDSHISSETHLVHHLQSEVERALPPFLLHTGESKYKRPRADMPFLISSKDGTRTVNRKNDLQKVKLLRTAGVCLCQITVKSKADGSGSLSSSISLDLPPFIFWVNFNLVDRLADVLKDFKPKSSEASNEKNVIPDKNMTNWSQQRDTHSLPNDSHRVNIFIPNARVVLCFPFKNVNDFGFHSSSDTFISLDFMSSSTTKKEKFRDTDLISSGRKIHSSTTLHCLNINLGNVDILLVSLACKDDCNSIGLKKESFYSHKILSAHGRTGYLSMINIFWQDRTMTAPWLIKRVKCLATSGNSDNKDELTGKGCKFSSVTTIKDLKDFNSHTRQEIIWSSSLYLHVYVSSITVNLDTSQYKEVYHLLHTMMSGLACDSASVREEFLVSQTSVLVECDSFEIAINLDKMENVKSSMQKELSGSWSTFKLKIRKLELLSVSDIGGSSGSNFLRVAHGEGHLRGSIAEFPSREFLLISCCNSSKKRGNGEGSNALSSWVAGSEIIHLWDPETLYNFTSIVVRCCTFVAVGGRLDWLEAFFSFFIVPSEIEHSGEDRSQNVDSKVSVGASFVLNLVDVGLSYEPYSESGVDLLLTSSSNVNQEAAEPYVACLLAASSMKLSNATVGNSIDNDYKITLRDLGILLCEVSGQEIAGSGYGAECLHSMGYVKVAGEALVEANLRTNCQNGLLWQVECSESHVHLNTCSDTFSGMIRLASQLEQLFTPDLEETFMHLETRWNNVQQAQEMIFSNADVPSQVKAFNPDRKNKLGEMGWMNVICEDARVFQHDYFESQLEVPVGKRFVKDACDANTGTFSQGSHFNVTVPVNALDNGQTSFLVKACIPELIEDYCVSESRPLSELINVNQSSNAISRSKSRNMVDRDPPKMNCGWYGDSSVRIVENHISEVIRGINNIESEESKTSFDQCAGPVDAANAKGRVLLKNINIRWKMHDGSHWHGSQKIGQQSKHGKDTAVCLELALSGMDFKYDVFCDGEVLASKLCLSVQDMNFYDNSKDAPWKMVLGYYHSKDHPRETSSKALKFDLETIRPDPLTPLEEYRVSIGFSPLLLHLHQRQLDFLIIYFGGGASSNDQRNSISGRQSIAEEALLPYIQRFDMWPLLIRVDYSPRRVDLAALSIGKYVELVNLVPWKGVELQLKHVVAHGVYGWSNIGEAILGESREWLEDISQNQIHKLLQGLPTIRSVVSISSGAAKLVSLPLENYRKDHRLLKGIQRGTIAFLRSISLEAAGLGVHLTAGAHDILFQAESILTSNPPVPSSSSRKTNIRFNQPKGALQGIHQACESLSDGLGRSASALLRTPLMQYQRNGNAGSALATAVRATPLAAIAPAEAAARALHCAFLGVRNSLDPDHKKESIEKYQGPSQSREHIQ